jgi:hypothetical protein
MILSIITGTNPRYCRLSGVRSERLYRYLYAKVYVPVNFLLKTRLLLFREYNLSSPCFTSCYLLPDNKCRKSYKILNTKTLSS